VKGWTVSLVVLLAACAGGPAKPLAPVSTIAPARIEAISHWRADGRVAIQRGNEGWSATLRWQKSDEEFLLRLIAPLGRGTYQITGNNQQVQFIAPSGEQFYSSDAESLMNEQLGWSIPLAGAEYWLRGVIAPSSSARSVNRGDDGLLLDMEQAGWRISVLRRMQVDEFALPAKLFMHHGDLKVRIVVTKWDLKPA